MRQHVVRWHHGRLRVLQRLEALHAREHRDRPVVGHQPRFLRQRLLRSNGNPVGEVGEVRRVRHPVVVEIAIEPGCEILAVLPGDAPARGTGHTVVRQDLADGLAGRAVEQVSTLDADLQPAPGHEARHDRGVVVGREVQVIGRCDFETAHLCRADRRRQKARLALIGKRELEPRGVEHGHTEEVDFGPMRGPDLARLVHFDFIAAQVPVVVRCHAARVFRIGGFVKVGPGKADFLGFAARFVLADEEARLIEIADLAFALDLRLGAADPVEPAPQRHIPLTPDRIAGEIIFEPVGEHGLPPRAQLDLARGFEALLGGTLETVSAQEYRAAFVGRTRRTGGARRTSCCGHDRPRCLGCIDDARRRRLGRRLARRQLPERRAGGRCDLTRHAQIEILPGDWRSQRSPSGRGAERRRDCGPAETTGSHRGMRCIC